MPTVYNGLKVETGVITQGGTQVSLDGHGHEIEDVTNLRTALDNRLTYFTVFPGDGSGLHFPADGSGIVLGGTRIPADVLIGELALVWRGVFTTGTDYEAGDVVTHGGSTYRAIVAHTATTPPPDDPARWAVLAAKGDQGPQGIQGLQGPQGDPGPDNVLVGKTVAPVGPDADGKALVYDHDTETWVTSQNVGVLIDVLRDWGRHNAYVSIANNQAYQRASGQRLELVYTPPVDVWFDVTAHVGNLTTDTTVYYYAYMNLRCSPADVDGVNAASAILMQHASVNTHANRTIRRVFKLAAGTEYTFYMQHEQWGGSWRYFSSQASLYLEGKAFTR